MILLFAIQNAFGQKGKNLPKLGILNGKATSLPKPDYPQEAKDLCVGGKVEIEVLIDENGKVIEAKAISGDELLREVSVEAAKKVKFSQTLHLIGKVRGIVVYNFEPFVKCIKTGIVNKKAISLPKPKVANLNHPKHLRISEEQIVAVQIVIYMNGKVIAARAVSGHPILQPACIISAKQTKFQPITGTLPPIKIRALLVYKFKPDGTIDTDIERDDKSVIGTPINLLKPPKPFCNCRFGGQNPSVLVEAKTDEQGNVVEAKAISGHPFLGNLSEKAALESKFLPTSIKAKILIQYNFKATNESASDVNLESIEIKEIKINN